jgi:hypothetical protein
MDNKIFEGIPPFQNIEHKIRSRLSFLENHNIFHSQLDCIIVIGWGSMGLINEVAHNNSNLQDWPNIVVTSWLGEHKFRWYTLINGCNSKNELCGLKSIKNFLSPRYTLLHTLLLSWRLCLYYICRRSNLWVRNWKRHQQAELTYEWILYVCGCLSHHFQVLCNWIESLLNSAHISKQIIIISLL